MVEKASPVEEKVQSSTPLILAPRPEDNATRLGSEERIAFLMERYRVSGVLIGNVDLVCVTDMS